jgi:hypothetical protein
MTRTRALSAPILVALLGASAFAACSANQDGRASNGSGGNGAAEGGAGAGGGSAGAGGGLFDASTGGKCNTSADCDGALCISGVCCDSAAAVCGSTCCTGGTVCLFDKCVTPGKTCHTAGDCSPGEYCETGLGDQPGDGGAEAGPSDAGADGPVCTQPLPLAGKCLPLPPVCDDDAGATDGGCIAKCEYHPPVGQLDAVVKWQWGPTATTKANFTDVWATPTVGRVYDGNCDGQVDELDAPNVVFVSGKSLNATTGLGVNCNNGATGTPIACQTGVLRLLDGRTGAEIWSLAKASPSSSGFAGLSVALGDIDGDTRMDIVAVTGEGYVVLVDANGNVVRTSDKPVPTDGSFGWGGGVAIADMDGDGSPEIAYGRTVFSTTNGAITLKFTGTGGVGPNAHEALSTFADVDGAADGHLELVAGNTVYEADGSILWQRSDIGDGFPAIGDFDGDDLPDVVVVTGGKVYVLQGATGQTELGPLTLPGTGFGGPPTVADFDGDGKPEIGIAQATYYAMLKPDYANTKIDIVWQTQNHDLSSSVTGSSVFDFEGDGRAEVVYADECFLWVFDGQTGAVRYATPHTSWTGTEASVVADVDGDGRAEMLMVSNSADPSANGWKCMDANGTPVTMNGATWVKGPAVGSSYRGITVFGDKASSWVGTRTLWNEHTYHVSNICDDRDTACDPPNVYGSLPKTEKKNWSVPWLNDFRQNVQDKGLFDAPDATVSLAVDCTDPVLAHVSVRNAGLAALPAGVNVGVFVRKNGVDTQVAQTATTHALFPGQTEKLDVALPSGQAQKSDSFVAKIVVDPNNVTFHECRDDNDESNVATASCPH